MYIIAGLGNPGGKYNGTKHNVGFETIDILTEKYGIPLDFEKHRSICGKGIIEGEKVILVKPLTFMNLSGEALREIVSYYKIDPSEELIVISDDIDLDPGRIRVRPSGSAGGHNGLKNIISELHTDLFSRVRIGVGKKPREWDLADWVLSGFSKEDSVLVSSAKKRAAEAVSSIILDGCAAAMNTFNRKPSEPDQTSANT
ncbi:MAG: aminoacyl-tRNA hydrolase [Lachnospiraceae bacterium]|nr:aminoacyl-tRNA hydrolase [Lachnospiraceae bacterium]MCR5025691.1 aminoacyl-tRNA hydrolase [Lachnospiraceae bacterium]